GSTSCRMMPFFLTIPINRIMPMMPITERSIPSALERVLETAPRGTPADRYVLGCLQKEVHAFNLCNLRPQAIDDLGCGKRTLLAWLQNDNESRGVGGLRIAVAPVLAVCELKVGTFGSRRMISPLQAQHLLGGDFLSGLRHPLDQAGVLDRD